MSRCLFCASPDESSLLNSVISATCEKSWSGGRIAPIERMHAASFSQWFISENVCALCDSERHLAHVVNIGGQWFAFDATHLNTDGAGCLFIGSFVCKASAMQAAESETLRLSGPLTYTAVSSEAPEVSDFPLFSAQHANYKFVQ